MDKKEIHVHSGGCVSVQSMIFFFSHSSDDCYCCYNSHWKEHMCTFFLPFCFANFPYDMSNHPAKMCAYAFCTELVSKSLAYYELLNGNWASFTGPISIFFNLYVLYMNIFDRHFLFSLFFRTQDSVCWCVLVLSFFLLFSFSVFIEHESKVFLSDSFQCTLLIHHSSFMRINCCWREHLIFHQCVFPPFFTSLRLSDSSSRKRQKVCRI